MDMDNISEQHGKPIFEAAKRNDENALRYYIEKLRLPPTKTNTQKQTAAHIAAQNNNINILKFLLEKDESIVKLGDINGNTLLHLAVENDSLEMVKFLVEEKKADIYQGNQICSQDTPIHTAAERGRLSILKYFVEQKNADVNVKNEEGQPPIFFAAKRGQLDVIKFLAEKCNASLTMVDRKGDNILFISVRNGDLSVPQYLLDDLKINFDLKWRDRFGYTIVHMAAGLDNTECLKYFVEEKKADVNIADNTGCTPLHEAAFKGQTEMVQYLLEHGADIKRKNKKGKTPSQVCTDKQVKKYLQQEAMKKRARRSVPETFLQTSSSASQSIAASSGFLSGLDRSSDKISASQVQSILMVVGMMVRRARGLKHRQNKPISMLTYGEIIKNKMDPIAFDAIHILPNFEEIDHP